MTDCPVTPPVETLPMLDSHTYSVAVRTLCEFTAKQGDLDLRFTPSATALEGVVGQAVVVARRGPGYQAELSLAGNFENLRVRGRADGYDVDANRLEEIKAFRGDLNAMPDNRRHLHWAQVKVYGALLCQTLGLKEVHLALVYFDVGNQEETVLSELFSTATLQAFFQDQCRRFAAWAAQEQAHRLARDNALRALKFPHAEFRTGQRPLSEAVFKAATAGRCLMAQAPTGIGKTVGTLFPLLKASATQRLDKVFYLAAKTPGRGLALEALNTLQRSTSELPLRVLELVARDKACEHPDKACHGESCPLAQGFYDRLPLARLEAVTVPQMDKAVLRTVALQHQICPYYLAQEMVRWSDVVVGDYNYYFDLNAMLFGMTVASQWRVGLLVDEAHNLIERGRKMYSAELTRSQVSAARALAPAAIKASLNRLLRAWVELENQQTQSYTVCKEVPVNFLGALSNVNAAFSEHLAAHPEGTPAALLNVYFDTLHFSRMCESYAEHSLFDISLIAAGELITKGESTEIEPTDSVLCVRNIVPAPFLKARFQAAHTTTLFSATLSPTAYHLDLLGLPDDTVCVDVASPFSATQLKVHIHRQISTRYTIRDASVQPIIDLIVGQFAQAPGNYLAFFSSFDYLQNVARALQAQHPDIAIWEQSRGMLETSREQFLARFTAHSRGIAFAVLGGAFAEGVDLPGRRLIGAFIATLGLPQVNPVNEQIKDRMQALFGEGQRYTYLYPGLQKVVQAAGRIIRTTSDEGVLHLMDDRFARGEVRALLPGWWRVEG
jgi:DNA excision repair protein ERCC-2